MKYIISVLMVSLCISMASAQDVYTSSGRPQHAKKEQQQKGFDRDRLIFGAGAVVGFGNGYADLGVSPFVGYRFTDHLSAGVGLGYQYLKYQQYLYIQILEIIRITPHRRALSLRVYGHAI